MTEHPSPSELHAQAVREVDAARADKIRERFHELMKEHGHIVPAQPGDDPNLPCGWPHG